MSEVAHAEVYWPGPTRLYDPDVDAGAVLMTGEQARALIEACEAAISEGLVIGHKKRWATTASNILRFTFGIDTHPLEDD